MVFDVPTLITIGPESWLFHLLYDTKLSMQQFEIYAMVAKISDEQAYYATVWQGMAKHPVVLWAS